MAILIMEHIVTALLAIATGISIVTIGILIWESRKKEAP